MIKELTKNMENNVAMKDEVSEEINNFIKSYDPWEVTSAALEGLIEFCIQEFFTMDTLIPDFEMDRLRDTPLEVLKYRFEKIAKGKIFNTLNHEIDRYIEDKIELYKESAMNTLKGLDTD